MSFLSAKIMWNCGAKRLLTTFSRNLKVSQTDSILCCRTIRQMNTETKGEIEPLSGLPFEDQEKGQLIYSGPLAKLVKRVKLFSLSTSFIGLGLQPLILLNDSTTLATKIAVGGFVNFFIFLTPLLIHFVAKKYVTTVYYNETTGQFTATTHTFFLRKREHKFTVEDVKVPDVPGIFTTIKVRGFALFMDPSMFFSKQAYIHLMGYDKPLDWRLPSKEQGNVNQSANEKGDKQL
ncbi:transmembrane protein 70 homolog, mitochondrial [Patella vulgata]|uniref:transmembrane protein 70 homolog, mitochondrial n=1 Tax=Patella vulgata TaxID=6465 RepID=UPI0024A88D20|nr:transmembrane protein 70 homolog, mitochondrial [Patella vulgata]